MVAITRVTNTSEGATVATPPWLIRSMASNASVSTLEHTTHPQACAFSSSSASRWAPPPLKLCSSSSARYLRQSVFSLVRSNSVGLPFSPYFGESVVSPSFNQCQISFHQPVTCPEQPNLGCSGHCVRLGGTIVASRVEVKERLALSASNSNAKSYGSLKLTNPYSIIEIR